MESKSLNQLKKANKWDVGLVFVLGLVCFLSGLCFQPFINFEARFALFAQDIFHHGLHFFPSIYNVPYPDYPALSIWLIYFASLLFGGLIKLSAVLPTALVSAGILVFSYLIAALYSRRWAWYAVLILLSSLYFVQSARTISLDQYVSLVTVMLSYIVIRHCETSCQRFGYHVCCLLVAILLLGIWFRGPMGLVIPSAAVVAILLVYQQYKNIWLYFSLSILALVISMVMLLSFAYWQGGESFLHDVIVMQVTGRMHPGHSYPMWFYLKSLLESYNPGFVVMLGVLLFAFPRFIKTKPEKKLLWALFLWVMIIVVGMSIPGEKKTRYLLPVMPAIALLASWLWVHVRQPISLHIFKLFINGLLFFVPALMCVALYTQQHHFQSSQAELVSLLRLHVLFLYVFFVGIFILQAAYFFARKNLNFRYEVVLLIGLSLQIVVTQVLLVQPILHYLNRAESFVQRIEKQRSSGDIVYFYHITRDGGDNVYFVNAAPREVPAAYLTKISQLVALPEKSLVLMHQKDFDSLSPARQDEFIVIVRGNYGRREAIALIKA